MCVLKRERVPAGVNMIGQRIKSRKVKIALNLIILMLILVFAVRMYLSQHMVSVSMENGEISLGNFIYEDDNIVMLEGQTRFYDSMLLTLDDIHKGDKNYNLVNLKDKWGTDKGVITSKGYGTYYFKVKLPKGGTDYGLILPEISTAYQLSVDGRIITGKGAVADNEINHVPTFRQETVTFEAKKNYIEIVINVSNFSYRYGGIMGAIGIGSGDNVREFAGMQYSKTAALSSAAFILGICYLAIYTAIRKKKEYLYFALFSLTLSVLPLTYGSALLFRVLELSWINELMISITLTNATLIFLIQYIRSVYSEFDNKLVSNLIVIAFALFTVPIIATIGNPIRTRILNIYIIMEYLTAAFYMVMLLRGAYKRISGSVITFISIGLLIMFYWMDIRYGLVQVYTPYGFFAVIVLQAVVLSVKFSESYIGLEKTKDNLDSSLEWLEEKNKELKESQDKLESINIELDQRVMEKTARIQSLLDNGGRAILYINSDCKVGSEHSGNCIDIFGINVEGSDYPSLIYPKNTSDKIFMRGVLAKIFEEEEGVKRDVYLTLLPEELYIGEKVFDFKYRMVTFEMSAGVMVIMEDITKLRKLEKSYEEELKGLKSAMSIMTDTNQFMDFIIEFKNFWDEDLKISYAERRDDKEFLNELRLKVHCQKGNMSIYGLGSIAEKLHYLEDEIDYYNSIDSNLNDLISYINRLSPSKWVEKDINDISKRYGLNLDIHEKTYSIKESQLIMIEESLRNSSDWEHARKYIEDIKTVTFGTLTSKYYDYCRHMGATLEKKIELNIIGGENIIDRKNAVSISNMLTALIRNMIYHGIESPSERNQLGKDETGSITIGFEVDGEFHKVWIEDDGRGMDLEKSESYSKNIMVTGYDSNNQSDSSENIKSVMNYGTTLDMPNLFAGRGLGMGIVAEELKIVSGKLTLVTEFGLGTKFEIRLPKMNRGI